MKKTLSILLALVMVIGVFAGCTADTKKAETAPEAPTTKITPEAAGNVISPLPETLDADALDNCTVAVSLEKGDAYVDDSGKMVMKVKAYSYELYDMIDIAALEVNDVIVRLGEEVKVTELEVLDSGLVRINGGLENGGFDLASDESTVYYEVGMDDTKNYYELNEATIPVSTEFEYLDESAPDAEAKLYYPGDFLTDDAGIEYNFVPNNTSIVIEDGYIVKMTKVYMP